MHAGPAFARPLSVHVVEEGQVERGQFVYADVVLEGQEGVGGPEELVPQGEEGVGELHLDAVAVEALHLPAVGHWQQVAALGDLLCPPAKEEEHDAAAR